MYGVYIYGNLASECSWTLVILTIFSSRSQSSGVLIKHIQLHAKSKPTFTIACTINYNSDYARNIKSYITTIDPNKNK